METDYQKDLFWHALNYRSASPLNQGIAQIHWLELVACVNRLIADGLPIDAEGQQITESSAEIQG